jgi:hypothetical protein
MIGSGKVIGGILVIVGVVLCGLMAAFTLVGAANGQTSPAGTVLGLVIGIVLLLPFAGVGAYLFTRGSAEEKELAVVRQKERLLGLIQSQGKVTLNTIMVEQRLTREQVKNYIYDLVQQGLFSGYIDWPSNTFYGKDAARVGSNKCPNCGGVREIVGKGVVKCPYCGVELFIPPDAPQTTATPVPPPGWTGAAPPAAAGQ